MRYARNGPFWCGQSLQRELQLTYLFISHDLGVVRHMCDRVAVMYLGVLVEMADRDALFSQPLHPDTVALWSAAPSFDPRQRGRSQRIRLMGDPPSPIDLPSGCRFAGRCPAAEAACREAEPPLTEVSRGHFVRCRRVTVVSGVPQPVLRIQPFGTSQWTFTGAAVDGSRRGGRAGLQ